MWTYMVTYDNISHYHNGRDSQSLAPRGQVFKCHYLFLTFWPLLLLQSFQLQSPSRFPGRESHRILENGICCIHLCVFTEVAPQTFSFCLIPVSQHPCVFPQLCAANHLKYLFRAHATGNQFPMGLPYLGCNFQRGKIFLPILLLHLLHSPDELALPNFL